MKACTVCNVVKTLDQFYNSQKYRGGKSYRCKDCDKAAGKIYVEKHKERKRKQQQESNWKAKYGLDREGYNELWESQGGVCSVCKTPLIHPETYVGNKHKKNTSCVDHDHVSGRVRAILCTMCNKGLGIFNDDPDLLNAAYLYLKHHASDIH